MHDPAAEVRRRCIRGMLDELIRLDHEPGESEIYLNRLMCLLTTVQTANRPITDTNHFAAARCD